MAADMIIKKESSVIRAYPLTEEAGTWLDENYDDWDEMTGVVIAEEFLDEEIDSMKESGLMVVKKF